MLDTQPINAKDREAYSGIEAFSSSLMFSRLYSLAACSSTSSLSFLSAYGWVKAANVLAPFGTELCDAKLLRCEASGVHFGRGNNRVVNGCDIWETVSGFQRCNGIYMTFKHLEMPIGARQHIGLPIGDVI